VWNSTPLDGDVVEEVATLRQGLDGEIVVHGSCNWCRPRFENDLGDELRLMSYPVVLGSKRVSGETTDEKTLRLLTRRPSVTAS
jgi:dihydrofolate reductase